MKFYFLSTLFLLSMIGCASLTPYSEAISKLPAERILKIDDQQIHVEQSGRGDPLVMLHGFAASTFEFRKIIPELSKEYRVVAIDLNGFGYTERPEPSENYTPDGQLKMVAAVLDRLEIDEFHLLGHSFGGSMSLLFAGRNPERVRDLILISPVTEFGKPPLLLRSKPGRAVAYGMSRFLISRPKLFRKTMSNAYFQKEQLTVESAEEYRNRLLVEGLPDAFRGFSESMEAGEDVEIAFENLKMRTLVVAGRHDAVVPLASCKAAAAALPRGKIVILENSGHSGPEEEPEVVIDAILKFLRYKN